MAEDNKNGESIKVDLPNNYVIDFDKVNDVEDVIAILKGLNIYLTMHDQVYEKSPMKHLLKKYESTAE